jgi:hypothetical protein
MASLIQDGESDSDLMVGAFFAFADCVTSITAFASDTPSRGDLAYLVGVAAISTLSVLAVLASCFLLASAHKRRTARRMIVGVTIFTFILGVLLDVHARKVKNNK